MYIDNFEDLLAWVKNNRLASIETISIDLSTARTDRLLEVAGLVVYASEATDSTTSLQVRHNEISSGLITLTKGYGPVFPFYRLYLTNTAQAGKTITLIIGRASPFDIKDNRNQADMLTALEAVRDELKGSSSGTDNTNATIGTSAVLVLAANTSRKAFMVSAPAANTGKIYIGFTSGLTTSKGIAELQPGMSLMLDDYQGTVYAISGTAAQSLYYGEW